MRRGRIVLLDLTDGLDVLLVHVTGDLDELERRERQRGDRQTGMRALRQK